jgi:hypothetical protein
MSLKYEPSSSECRRTTKSGDWARCPPPARTGRRGTSLIRKRTPLGPFRRPMPRVLWGSSGGGAFSYERGTPVGVRSKVSRVASRIRRRTYPETLQCMGTSPTRFV